MRRWTADWLPPEKLSSFGPAKPKVVLPAWRCFRRMGGEQDQLRLTDRIPAQIVAAASRLRSVRASDADDHESGQAPESKWFGRGRRVPDLTTESVQCFADHERLRVFPWATRPALALPTVVYVTGRQTSARTPPVVRHLS